MSPNKKRNVANSGLLDFLLLVPHSWGKQVFSSASEICHKDKICACLTLSRLDAELLVCAQNFPWHISGQA